MLPLMVMHVAVASLCLTLLPRLGAERAERRATPMVPRAAAFVIPHGADSVS